MQGSCTGLYLRLGFGCPAVCLAFTGKGGDIKLPVYGCGCARHSRLLPFLSYDHMWLPQAVLDLWIHCWTVQSGPTQSCEVLGSLQSRTKWSGTSCMAEMHVQKSHVGLEVTTQNLEQKGQALLGGIVTIWQLLSFPACLHCNITPNLQATKALVQFVGTVHVRVTCQAVMTRRGAS